MVVHCIYIYSRAYYIGNLAGTITRQVLVHRAELSRILLGQIGNVTQGGTHTITLKGIPMVIIQIVLLYLLTGIKMEILQTQEKLICRNYC